jgi:RHS repeat-associated protein
MEAVQKYDVYGLVRSGQSGSSSQKYVGSLGHESDTNTGLIYMRARYMDPVVGRFLSEDPSKDGANWFVYCESNPVSKLDNTGEDVASVSTLYALVGVFFVGLAYGYVLSADKLSREQCYNRMYDIWMSANYINGYDIAKKLGAAAGCIVLASIAFGLAVTGLDAPNIVGNIIRELQISLDFVQSIVSFASAGAKCVPFAKLVVFVALLESVTVLGACVSVGADV